jgi:ribulose-phosphate 3-epimerase
MGSAEPTAVFWLMASIVPSILAGDFARLGESLELVQALGVSAIHIDVKDGHFRPQISVGQPVVKSIRKATHLKLDVHLMIERPERYVEDFVRAGADSLAIHPEATQNLILAIESAQKMGRRVGVALNASTPVENCYEVLADLDFVLLDTCSETFMQRTLSRVVSFAKVRAGRGMRFGIQVEGDMEASQAEVLFAAGADILVMGSAIFDNSEQGEAVRKLVRSLSGRVSAPGDELKSPVQ